jgi:DNA invertase Pin-like site-specific DNA recombinase
MLTVLGGLAEFERELIRARTGEGRARALARGVKMGRPPKLTPHQIKEALRRRDAGEPMREIARTYNVSHSTISRLGASRRQGRPCQLAVATGEGSIYGHALRANVQNWSYVNTLI